MFSTKTRTTAAAFLAALSIGVATTSVAPTSAQAAVKASPTGDSQLDDYCSKVAGLINHALQKSWEAAAAGDPDESAQWHALAEYMARSATQKGCHFYSARITGRLPTQRPTVKAQP